MKKNNNIITINNNAIWYMLIINNKSSYMNIIPISPFFSTYNHIMPLLPPISLTPPYILPVLTLLSTTTTSLLFLYCYSQPFTALMHRNSISISTVISPSYVHTHITYTCIHPYRNTNASAHTIQKQIFLQGIYTVTGRSSALSLACGKVAWLKRTTPTIHATFSWHVKNSHETYMHRNSISISTIISPSHAYTHKHTHHTTPHTHHTHRQTDTLTHTHTYTHMQHIHIHIALLRYL